MALKLDKAIVGGSGLRQIGGFVYEDFLTQLNGLNGVKLYREMSDNDPIVGALLTAITLLLRGVTWRVEAAEDSGEAGDEAADFVQQCLFEDMSHPFSDFIGECLSFLPYGFSCHEIVWKVRVGPDENDPSNRSKFTDRRIGIRKLAGRPQDSIWKWSFQDDGGVDGFWQLLPYQAGKPLMVFIPIQKALIFRTQIAKNNPEGRSILRNAYIQYVRKQVIEAAEGRAALRAAGIVELRIPSAYLTVDADEAEKAIAASYASLANNLALDKQGAITLPSDRDEHGNALFEVKYNTTTASKQSADMGKIIERYDQRIATTALADFLLLGQQAVGSFALSSDKTALFAASLKAYNTMIADVLNRVLLPRLWELNQFDHELMPKAVPGDVEQRRLDEVGTFIQQLAQAGMPLFPDEQLEETLRDIGHLPPPSGDARSNNPNITPPEPGAEPTIPPGDEPVDKGELGNPFVWKNDDVVVTTPETLLKRIRRVLGV